MTADALRPFTVLARCACHDERSDIASELHRDAWYEVGGVTRRACHPYDPPWQIVHNVRPEDHSIRFTGRSTASRDFNRSCRMVGRLARRMPSLWSFQAMISGRNPRSRHRFPRHRRRIARGRAAPSLRIVEVVLAEGRRDEDRDYPVSSATRGSTSFSASAIDWTHRSLAAGR